MQKIIYKGKQITKEMSSDKYVLKETSLLYI